jgi:large subunit ribosomal protein L17
MRHRKATLKLNRTSSHRDAMFRNMVTSLFKHQRIRTTDVKAKELRRWADNLITLAKRNDIHARRQALSIIREKEVVHKLFAEASEKYGSRSGGYTRIIKLGRRPGDASPISMVELIFSEVEKKKKTKKKAKSPVAKKKVETKKGLKEDQTEEIKAPEKEIESSKVEEEVEIEEKTDKVIGEPEKVEPDAKSASSDAEMTSEDTGKKADDRDLESAESKESDTEETKKSEEEPEKPETKE